MPPKRVANQPPNASKRLKLAGRDVNSVKKSGARKAVQHDMKGFREHTISTRDSKDPTTDRTFKELYRTSEPKTVQEHQDSSGITNILEDSTEGQLLDDVAGSCEGEAGTTRSQVRGR